jgi:hydroxymethylbilane synthase
MIHRMPDAAPPASATGFAATNEAMPAALPSPLVIATRESRLALWQAEHVKALLHARFGLPARLEGMTTKGDQILDRTLAKVGGKGLFVKELEAALEEGRAHLAVHSLKDVPMDLPPGFALAAILPREDPRDAFVSPRHASVEALPPGAVVGTSSLRRVVQLRARRPDLVIEPLRGNLDTRLRKLDEGGYDAIVLAAAGLVRLGLAARIRTCFELGEMIPAAGQGALGIEVRADADALRERLGVLVHRPTWLAAQAERAVSRALGGSCSMPLAAHAHWAERSAEGGRLVLDAALGDPSPAARPLLVVRVEAEFDGVFAAADPGRESGDEGATSPGADAFARDLGRRAADALVAAGGRAYLAAAEALAAAP